MFRFNDDLLSLSGHFLSVIKDTSYPRDTEHYNLKKWVNGCNLANGRRYYYPFWVVPFYW